MSPATKSRRWPSLLAGAIAVVMIGCVIAVLGALAAGYRPVVITTGSMGDAAPTGSLVVAAPRSVEDIVVGDIVVMRRADSAPITHRVVAIELSEAGSLAITRGDANPTNDPVPYELSDQELVARWVTPGAGAALESLRDPRLALAVLSLVIIIATLVVLWRIWTGNHSDEDSSEPPPTPPSSPSRSGSRVPTGATIAAAALVCAGVVWALQTSSAAVDSNLFGTTDCFGAQLASVQSGETVHAMSGILLEPITTVDPSRAFVMASVRSSSNDVADSSARVRLWGDSTIEIRRETDAGTPPPITVDWSVVEYGCGTDVQRGVVVGDGTNQIDVPITAVDTASSFVLVNALAPSTAADFGPNELFLGELSAPDTLSIRGATSSVFAIDQSFAWQVVTFQDPAEIEVQTTSSTISAGATSDTLTLATPVDPDTTFLTTFVTSDSTGPDIGERLVRARLVDATTVVIDRSIGGDAIDVHVQAVTLMDGTTVRHGTVDFSAGQASRAVAIAPVDATRSTAISTVAIPGLVAGGMTDHVADDVVGEASATFVLTDPATVTITRDSTASNASFGWQVIEWAGPGWWDTDFGFRQRIVVDSVVAAPDDYTVALPIDHAALVSSDLSLANGDDLRILRWDGSAWSELDRLLDDDSAWDQIDTTVRFRTTDPIAAGQNLTYWLYMSNPGAGPAPSDPEAVYLLVEDFETGTLGDFEDRTAGTGWYAADPWARRIPVTVPAGTVGSTLTDFPLLVSITEPDLGANAQSDGSDIRFTAADGATALSHEIESFANGTGALTAWVNLPTLSAVAPTTIYLYYGAADAPSHEDIRGTWSDNIEAAWHLDRDPAGSAPQLDDSSPRNHDGLSVGAMNGSELVPGRVGQALHFDGVDDGVQADRLDLEGLTGLTISGWVHLDAYTADASVLSKANSSLDRQVDLVVRSDGSVRAHLLLDSGEVEVTTAAAIVSTVGWHHVAATWDGSALTIIVDGTSRVSVATTGAIDPRHEMPVHLGNVATQDRALDGLLDEVRVETTARSVDWLAATETNQRTPGSFLTIGGIESGTWFDQGIWAYRKPVVVDSDQVSTDLFDFALMVQVTDARLQAAAQSCACDLVFTGADGTTRLDHAVEAYDPGTGALTAWVSVPVLSGSEDTQLFLYYGNPTAVDQQDPSAVFGTDADLQILGAP